MVYKALLDPYPTLISYCLSNFSFYYFFVVVVCFDHYALATLAFMLFF